MGHGGNVTPGGASLRLLREPGDGIAGIAADSLRINGGIRQFRQVKSLRSSATTLSVRRAACFGGLWESYGSTGRCGGGAPAPAVARRVAPPQPRCERRERHTEGEGEQGGGFGVVALLFCRSVRQGETALGNLFREWVCRGFCSMEIDRKRSSVFLFHVWRRDFDTGTAVMAKELIVSIFDLLGSLSRISINLLG